MHARGKKEGLLLLENTLWGHTRPVTIDFNLMIASAGKLDFLYYANTEAQIVTHFLNLFHRGKFELRCITIILFYVKKIQIVITNGSRYP